MTARVRASIDRHRWGRSTVDVGDGAAWRWQAERPAVLTVVIGPVNGRRDRGGIVRPERWRALASDDQGGGRFRGPSPAERDANAAGTGAKAAAGPRRSQLGRVRHAAEGHAVPDRPAVPPQTVRGV